MTLQVKKSGAYAAPLAVSVKKNGVYTAVVGVFAKVSGIYQSVLGGSYVEPTPLALSPTSISQQPTAVYSMTRLVAGYVGNCLAIKDSANTTRVISFDANGSIVASCAAMAAAATAAGATTVYTVSSWYDQTPNANNLSSAARPKLIFPNAPANYEDAYIDFFSGSGGINLATTLTPFNFGGTANAAVHVVCKRLGYGSAVNPHPRPGVRQVAIPSDMISYGTLSANVLLRSVPTTSQDSLGCSAAAYGMPEELMLDETEPSDTAGWSTMWFNQTGAVVAGGGDVRKHWSNRPHGKSAANAQRLVFGTNGALTSPYNGGLKEVIVYNNGTAISDTEAWAVGVWQSQQYQQQPTLIEPRYYAIFTGQSNAVMHLTNTTSGDGSAGSASAVRRFVPKFAQAMGITNLDRVRFGTESKTCVGGTPMLKRHDIGDADAAQYWWDEDTNGPGNLATPGVGAYGNWSGTVLAVPGIKYKKCMVIHAQGEEDSKSVDATFARLDQWGAQTASFFAWMRGIVSQPEMPIIIQPLSKYANNVPAINHQRRIQKNVLGAMPNVVMAADTGHLARGWDANELAHFGSMYYDAANPTDPTINPSSWGYAYASGGAEDGYQRLAWQDALAAAHAFGASTFWRGPEVTGAAVSGPATIDLTISYPAGCNGTDFSSSSGTFSGFRAFTSGGNLTVSSVSKISATTIRVTLSAAVPVGASIVYEPNYATYLTHMRDNNAVLAMPVASSDIFVVS